MSSENSDIENLKRDTINVAASSRTVASDDLSQEAKRVVNDTKEFFDAIGKKVHCA